MRYWDSSSLVPLIVDEQESKRRRELLSEDPLVVTWWASRVECASAVNRLHRESALTSEDLMKALGHLDLLVQGWTEVQPREEVRRRALRLLRIHPLRAADAVQLAAALAVSREEPESLQVVCSDGRLVEAARKEDFTVL